jgi:hypothetical protein
LINTGFEVFEYHLKKQYDIFNLPFGRETVYEGKDNTVADFFIAEGGYFLGLAARAPENIDLKKGCLYDYKTHEKLLFVVASNIGFSSEDIDFLVSNVMNPDKEDIYFDRYWKHYYDPIAKQGSAPQSCNYNYIKAVNENNLQYLACAIHYLTDVGCVFHTTPLYQNYHIWYEKWLDENINNVEIVIRDIQQDNVLDMVKNLAVESRNRADKIIDYILSEDYTNLLSESVECLNNAASYINALSLKFYNDLENGVTYVLPVEQSINNLVTMGVIMVAPIGLYNMKKEY